MSRLAPLTIAIALAAGTFAGGCAKPSAANITLRKQVQEQADEIGRLRQQHVADQADMKSRAATGPASAPALAAGSAETLFTTHGIRIARLSGPKNDGITVHVVPTDDDGDDLKAAGTFTVDAFDLSADGKRVGRWAFDAATTRTLWNGSTLRYEYVLPCPWPTAPSAESVTVKVTFVDALTGRTFEAKQDLKTRSE